MVVHPLRALISRRSHGQLNTGRKRYIMSCAGDEVQAKQGGVCECHCMVTGNTLRDRLYDWPIHSPTHSGRRFN